MAGGNQGNAWGQDDVLPPLLRLYENPARFENGGEGNTESTEMPQKTQKVKGGWLTTSLALAHRRLKRRAET